MYAEKKQHEVFFKVTEKQSGIKLDLNTGLLLSAKTGQQYVSQNSSNISRLFPKEAGLPEVFRTNNISILANSEPVTIIAFYVHAKPYRHLNPITEYISILQMLYTRGFNINFRYVIDLCGILHDNPTVNKTELVNYVIDRNITQFNTLLSDFKLYKQGIDVSALTPKQKTFMRDLNCYGLTSDKIEYLMRKVFAENISYIMNVGRAIDYFDLCERMNIPYNQKNFFDAYGKLLYRQDVEREKEMLAKVEKNQRDTFKLDTDRLYCVMPKTPKEFSDMGDIMSNCIGSYYSRVSQGHSSMIFVYDRLRNRPVIVIEVEKVGKNYNIRQFLGYRNSSSVQREYNDFYEAYKAFIKNMKD